MIGLGTDIVEISRINKSFDFNKKEPLPHKLVERVLTKKEQSVFVQRWRVRPERAIAFLATRYAAKEAFSKAMGCGIGGVFSFQDLAVLNHPDGRPLLEYSESLQKWLAERQAQAHVSVSDEKHYAVATVILSKLNQGVGV